MDFFREAAPQRSILGTAANVVTGLALHGGEPLTSQRANEPTQREIRLMWR
jgi:hypothetical protein